MRLACLIWCSSSAWLYQLRRHDDAGAAGGGGRPQKEWAEIQSTMPAHRPAPTNHCFLLSSPVLVPLPYPALLASS